MEILIFKHLRTRLILGAYLLALAKAKLDFSNVSADFPLEPKQQARYIFPEIDLDKANISEVQYAKLQAVPKERKFIYTASRVDSHIITLHRHW